MMKEWKRGVHGGRRGGRRRKGSGVSEGMLRKEGFVYRRRNGNI